MKSVKPLLLFTALLLTVLTGCNCRSKRRTTNWMRDYEHVTANPYSVKLLQQSLPLLFPGAKMETLKPYSRLTSIAYSLQKNHGPALLVMVGSTLQFNEAELDQLTALVQDGNQVVLSADELDATLLDRLQLTQRGNAYVNEARQQIYLKNSSSQWDTFRFSLHNQPIQQRFYSTDTTNAYFSVLGANDDQKPNVLLFTAGKGRLILQSAPIAFSNHFLLQERNRNYLKQLFSYIDAPVSNIYFIPFNRREVTQSDFGAIWNNLATRTALLLCLLALAVYVAFEMKRRQKIIPILKPLDNSSVAFTETIGRLYYNNKNHSNLAEKMVQHFLEFVRQHYYLNTNVLDTEFTRLLAAKSGIEISKTDALVYNIKMVQDGLHVDEAFLFALYTQIQAFYNGK